MLSGGVYRIIRDWIMGGDSIAASLFVWNLCVSLTLQNSRLYLLYLLSLLTLLYLLILLKI